MKLTIPPLDTGRIYVFDVAEHALPEEDDPMGPALLLNLPTLDPTYAEVVHRANLGGMRLAEYIRTGYDHDLTAEEERALDDMGAHGLFVMSRAFDGQGATVLPNPGVKPVTTLETPVIPRIPTPMTSEAAKGTLAPQATPDAPPTPKARRKVWVYVVLALFAFFAVAAWRIASGNV